MRNSYLLMLRCCVVAFLTTLALGSYGQDSPTISCNPVTAGLGSDGLTNIDVIPVFGAEVEPTDDCDDFNYTLTFDNLTLGDEYLMFQGPNFQIVQFNCEALGSNSFTLSTECVDDQNISSVCTQDILIQDLIEPLICIDNVTIQCELDNGAAPLPIDGWSGSATDADYAAFAGNSAFPILSATDFIGDSNQTPVIDDCPDVPSINEALGYTGLPYVEENDECGGFTVTYSDELVDYSPLAFECENHSYTILRTWTATDASGNSNSTVQEITVEDTTAPEFELAFLPADVTVECDMYDAGMPAMPTAQDNCYLASVSLYSDNTASPVAAAPGTLDDNDDCVAFTATRVWRATDACGNFSEYTQTFTLIDTTSPVWDAAFINGVSLPVEVDAGNEPFYLIDLSAAFDDQNIPVGDNCLADIDLALSLSDGCSDDLDITWILNLVDPITGANQIDNGSGSTFSGSLEKGTYLLVFEAFDACGNFAGTALSFNVIDDTLAEVNWPTDVVGSTSQETSVLTGCDLRAAEMLAIRMEYVPFNVVDDLNPGEFTDNCEIVSFATEVTGASTRPLQTITNMNVGSFYGVPNGFRFQKGISEVTYSIVDCTGETQTHTFTVTVLDDEPAEIECAPFPATLNTSSDVEGNCDVCVVNVEGFSGDWSHDNWTYTEFIDPFLNPTGITPGNVVTTPTSVTLLAPDELPSFGFDIHAAYSAYAIVAPTSGLFSFNWNYNTTDFTGSSTYDEFGYAVNGSLDGTNVYNPDADLNYVELTPNGGSASQSGTVSVPLQAGDVFTFIQFSDIDGGTGTTISDMVMIEVPDPILMPVVSDNCPDYVLESDLQNCYEPGDHTVTWTVTDCGGNISECTIDFTVIDDEAPTLECPADQEVSNDAGECNALVEGLTPTVDDNCEGTIVNWSSIGATVGSGSAAADYSDLASMTFNVGETTVTYEAIDAAGNTSGTCEFTITVNDTEAPTVDCPASFALTTSADDEGDCSTTAASLAAIALADNCCLGAVEYAITGATEAGELINYASGSTAQTLDLSGIEFAKGVSTVEITTTDCSSNASETCSFTVTVTDDEAPAFGDCPDDITVQTVDTDCNQNVGWAVPQLANATDNCPLTEGVASISGETVYEMVDGVLVEDTGVNVMVSGTNASGIFPVGTRTVEYILTDDSGVPTPCSFDVTVEDNIMPVATSCPSDITVNVDLDCNPVVTLEDYTSLAVFEDNCGIDLIEQTPAIGTVYDGIGTNPALLSTGDTQEVTITATSNGQSVSCTFTITFIDNSGPNIACPADQVELASKALLDPADGCKYLMPEFSSLATANNSCGNEDPIVTQTNSPDLASYEAGDVVTVTLTAEDSAGNQTSCSFTVTFEDDIDPKFADATDGALVLEECGDDPAPVTAAVGECSAMVQLNAPSVVDCDGAVDVVPTVNGVEIDMLSSFEVCTTEVVWIATDSSGNSAEICSNTVTVNEALDPANQPTAACGDLTLGLTDNGTAMLNAANFGSDSFDNCSQELTYLVHFVADGVETATPEMMFDCSQVGTHEICLIVRDCSGNEGICFSTLTIQDKVNPIMICPADITIECSVSNGGSPLTGYTTPSRFPIEPEDIAAWDNTFGQSAEGGFTGFPESWDNCPGAFVTFSDESAQGNDPALCNFYNYEIERTWSIVDAHGNEGEDCVQLITVQDMTNPTVTSTPEDVFVNCDDPNYADKLDMAMSTGPATFEDNCASDNLTITYEETFENLEGCNAVGDVTGIYEIRTRTWTATDPCGNNSSTTQTIYTFDNSAPAISCPNGGEAIVYLTGADDDDCMVSVPLLAGAEDCQAEDLTYTYEIKDAVSLETLSSGEVNDASGDFMPGNYCVQFTVSDPCENTSSCQYFFSVEDNTLPVLDCTGVEDVAVSTDEDMCSALVSAVIPAATDNCSSEVSIEVTISGALALELGGAEEVTISAPDVTVADINFPLGETTISYVGYDEAGNATAEECSFTVTVTDDEAPSFDCALLEDVVMLTSEDGFYGGYTCNAPYNWKSPSLVENCELALYTVTLTDEAGDELLSSDTYNDESRTYDFPVGVTTVTYYAEDASGNSWTCSFTVTVSDDEDPQVNCNEAITVALDENGVYTLEVSEIDDESTDNCEVALSIDVADFDCTNIGDNDVVLTGVDPAGNSYTCTTVVTVEDNMAPVLTCSDYAVNTSDDENASVTCGYMAADGEFDAIATDNTTCFTLTNDLNGTSSLNGEVFSACAPTTVIWTATDDGGNTVTCTSIITVTDDEAPFALPRSGVNCGDLVNKIAIQGECSANMSWNDFTLANFADNCSGCEGELTLEGPFAGNNVECDGEPGGLRTATFPAGDTEVSYLVTDIFGNEYTCTFTVRVEESQDPVIQVPATTQDLLIDLCDSPVWPAFTPVAASDNCGETIITQSPAEGSPMNADDGDTFQVTLTATDVSGNTASGSYNVVIVNTCYGCLDATACNYNDLAVTSDESCIYATGCDTCSGETDGSGTIIIGDTNGNGDCDSEETAGCTDVSACNFLTGATLDDGSCESVSCLGCTDPAACNFDDTALIDDDSCESLSCAGCTIELSCNYDATATIDDGSCDFSCVGCTDDTACNYDETATIDSGACDFACIGCSDAGACNFNSFALPEFDDGSCEYETCLGCNDADACNFDEEAGIDDGSCIYADTDACQACSGETDGSGTIVELGADLNCDGICGDILGCTYPNACNYDADLMANVDDGSCDYSCFGCNDPAAENFNALADTNEFCVYAAAVPTCEGDFDNDGLIGVSDLSGFLSIFGTQCGE